MLRKLLAWIRQRLLAAEQFVMRLSSCISKNMRGTWACVSGDGQTGEEALAHLGILLDSVAAGVISLDGRGRIRVFNAAAERLFAVRREAVMGMQFGEAGRAALSGDRAIRALWDRLSDAVWAAGAAIDLEYEIFPREGPRRVISYSVYPLGITPWSVDKGVVILLEDITRRKEMEEEVSEARKRLQAVFDGITDGIQVVDNEFRVTAVNKSMSSLLKRRVAVGGHCFDACVFGAKICEDCPAAETFSSGRPATVTKRLPPRPSDNGRGPKRVVEISTFPLHDRGNRVVQVVEYIKDVTERVQMAERLEHSRRLAELGEMAARVAHEVRNPLNAITGAAHFLSSEYKNDSTILKFCDLIIRQASRMNQVASDLLAVSRPSSLRLTEVNINAVLEQSIDSLCDNLRRQGIVVRPNFGQDVPIIKADELQIEQALHNILRNAIEAMPEGGVLTASTAACGAGVEVTIEDTGPGIPEQDRERIFQAFFTTKARGTGLGLTIVKRVLENHGGDIKIEQPDKGGTRIVIRLPAEAIGNQA